MKQLDKRRYLRQPQKEALQVFLWLKFVGQNKSLDDIIKQGLLSDEKLNANLPKHFENKYIPSFLYNFFKSNNLKGLKDDLNKDPDNPKWDNLLKGIFHNFDYPNYLYSLPMGAGKTYLMACFIYTDLYFSCIALKGDPRFAQNFIIFAPSASKTAILPSLKTIKNFDPEYLFPSDIAKRLQDIIHIEVLDVVPSQRKDKLSGKNPNLEKVNRLNQTKKTGLVFITNAEKVVLERYADKDKDLTVEKFMHYNAKMAADIKKTNELRERLSKIENFTVILDEVHHSYSNDKEEKKLRLAVSALNQYNNINNVIGLSGTPYVNNVIEQDGFKIKLKQIQDIVYHYPLNQGIGKFLKVPQIRKAEVNEKTFILQSLNDFFKNFDIVYRDKSKSKMVFYCPSIAKLNDEVLPIIEKWYKNNRPGKEDEIFKYYTNVAKDEENYKLPKDSLTIFHNLDKSYCDKRVILLVAVGTEGWDCKSLTAVSLPRKQTTKNFVLQTTCRCLREVENAQAERALIYLCPENYEALDNELRENYHLSIKDIQSVQNQFIDVKVRKPNLGKLKYKQVKKTWKLVSVSQSSSQDNLKSFDFDYYADKYRYDPVIGTAVIGKRGLVMGQNQDDYALDKTDFKQFSADDFIYQISDCLYGKYNEAELYRLKDSFAPILDVVNNKIAWISKNPYNDNNDNDDKLLDEILSDIASCLADNKKYESEDITEDAEMELLQWNTREPKINILKSSGGIEILIPEIEDDIRTYIKHPEDIEEDFLKNENNIDINNISFNYVPYKMDSDFERDALKEILKLSEMAGLEVYFNGYKNQELNSFYIQTPSGIYTPDFLILRRENNKSYAEKGEIEKILIVETKGKPYYEDFKVKEKFIKEEFLRVNKNFRFHCFIDEYGKNDFGRQLDKFKELLREF